MGRPTHLQSVSFQDPKPSLLQALWRPMLLASVVLHAVVLSLPISSEPEPEPEEVAEVQEDSIQLSSLTAPPRPAPAPKAQPTPVSTPQPRPTPVRPRPNPVPSLRPSPAPSPIASPTPVPTPSATPVPSPSAEPIATATPTPEVGAELDIDPEATPANFDPSELQAELQASLQGIQGSTGLQPFPGVFRTPASFYASEDPEEWVAGIKSMQWFNNLRAEEVFSRLQDNYGDRGFTFEEIGEYGGGRVYKLKTVEGEIIDIVNVVPGKGNISTVVITWEFDPNAPPS